MNCAPQPCQVVLSPPLSQMGEPEGWLMGKQACGNSPSDLGARSNEISGTSRTRPLCAPKRINWCFMQWWLTLYILHSSVTLTLAILGTEELNLSLSSLICPRKERIRDVLPPGLQQLPVVNPATEQPHQKSLPVWFALSIEQQRVDQTSPSSLLSTCFSSATKQNKTTLTIWKGTTTNLEGNDCTEPNPVPRTASRSNPSSLNALALSLCWFQMSLGKPVPQPWFTLKHFHSRASLCIAGTFILSKSISTMLFISWNRLIQIKHGKCSPFDDQ